jgi:hypothetical protein
VVQDHLRFARVLAGGRFTVLDQALGVQPRVGVAFEFGRSPGEVDQQPPEHIARMGSCLSLRRRRFAQPTQASSRLAWQIPGFIGPVVEQEFAPVADRRSLRERSAHEVAQARTVG